LGFVDRCARTLILVGYLFNRRCCRFGYVVNDLGIRVLIFDIEITVYSSFLENQVDMVEYSIGVRKIEAFSL
jgi:hypothetical protein